MTSSIDKKTEELPQVGPVSGLVEASPKKQNKKRVIWAVVILALFLCAGAGYVGSQLYAFFSANSVTIAERDSVDDGNKIVTQEEEDIASVVAKVSPSVVSVVTKSSASSPYPYGAEQEGAGTGVIVGSAGYILTNKHVIDGVTTVGVVLADGTHYENVKVLGSDPLNDIAFLKIPDVSDLPVAELGDSTSIRVGQKVVAIGNSLGQYQNTVTSGIISGTGRPVSAQSGDSVETLTDLIQTDAAINPGNSGGPLLNLKGQVIGLNTAIVEDAQGIGFAIPIGSAKGALKGVLKGEAVERAYLGINYIPITADVAKEYGLSVKKGAYVYSGDNKSAVVADSPAAKAGIKDKDIITKVGDIEVGDRGSVASLVAEFAPGDTIELTILRDGKATTVKVTLAAYEK